MKQLLKKRARLARVRNVQHLQAAAQAAQAESRAATLESNAERLTSLRGSLALGTGTVFAGALSNAGELSMRLDAAREGMVPAIRDARASAERLGSARLEARVRQESADRLGARAEAAYADWRERKLATPHRRRNGGGGGDEM